MSILLKLRVYNNYKFSKKFFPLDNVIIVNNDISVDNYLFKTKKIKIKQN